MVEKIRNLKELEAVREKARSQINLRTGAKDISVTVHMGTCGIAAGARDLLNHLAQELVQSPAPNVILRHSSCAGLCDREPMITVTDKNGQNFVYGKLDLKKAERILHEHLLGGKPVTEYLVKT